MKKVVFGILAVLTLGVGYMLGQLGTTWHIASYDHVGSISGRVIATYTNGKTTIVCDEYVVIPYSSTSCVVEPK